MIPLVLVRLFGVALEFCRRRLSLSAGVLVSGLVMAVWAGARLAHRQASPGIPRALATQLASHAAATAAETIAVASAKRAAGEDSVTAAGAVVRARSHEAVAKRADEAADSLARATAWQEAYEARSREVSQLLTVDALKDTALVAEAHRGTALSAALQLTEVRAARADTLLNESVRLLGQESTCGLRCRAHRVLYVGAVLGAALIGRRLAKG